MAIVEAGIGPPAQSGSVINDRQFMDTVEQVRALRAFMVQQAIPIKPGENTSLSLGHLNMLRYHADGRPPTFDEWQLLEIRTASLYEHLSEPLRRKFLYSQIPNWVPRTVTTLGAIAVTALFIAFASHVAIRTLAGDEYFVFHQLIIFGTFLTWVAALGAMGSIAFIGMNALAIQEDATFDLTNSKLIVLRIALGALFGLVLTLPFGYQAFTDFCRDLVLAKSIMTSSALAAKSVQLLLPFILGFSTTVVILVLNQFIDAVQSFFGRKNSSLAPVTHGGVASQPSNTPTPMGVDQRGSRKRLSV